MEREARVAEEQRWIEGVLSVEELSSTRWTSRCAGTEASIRVEEATELLSAMPWRRLRDHLPRGDIKRRVQVGRPVADVVVAAPLRHTRHQRQHRRRAVERLDLRLLIDTKHHRCLRRVQVQADDVAHLVDELRIGRELERLRLVRLEPERPPIRLTADWLIPVAAAIERVDQCVAFVGCCSSVFTITRSTSSSLIVRGFPGRGSSASRRSHGGRTGPATCRPYCGCRPRSPYSNVPPRPPTRSGSETRAPASSSAAAPTAPTPRAPRH